MHVYYDSPNRAPFQKPAIFVVPTHKGAWHSLLGQPSHSVQWVPSETVKPPGVKSSFNQDLPVLYWSAGGEGKALPPVHRSEEGVIVFHIDIIATAIFMLSRWEETVVLDRDEHDRFPATASVAYKQGFLDRPIVDEYALILREWLKVLLPDWEPAPRRFSIKLSHDLDQIRHHPNAYWALRTFAGDLLKRGAPVSALWTATDAVSEALAPRRAGFYRDIFKLMALSEKGGFADTAFYVMAADPRPPDNDYDLASPMMQDVIEALSEQGFEIGFHAGYHTLNNLAQLAKEKTRLEALLGTPDLGGRQHYLRFQAPTTWRHWEQAGLKYDSTVGYADHEGFRCGTCYPFRPFDIEQDRELDLWELPLIAMDGTLRQYRELTPEQAEARLLALARRCQRVGGTFTLLWHNSSFDRDWAPWGPMYERVLHALAAMDRAPFTFPTRSDL